MKCLIILLQVDQNLKMNKFDITPVGGKSTVLKQPIKSLYITAVIVPSVPFFTYCSVCFQKVILSGRIFYCCLFHKRKMVQLG